MCNWCSSGDPGNRWKADVIKAAHLCAEAALRLVKPGNQNTETEAWNKVAHAFNCMLIEGVLSHQLKQHMMDGEKKKPYPESYRPAEGL